MTAHPAAERLSAYLDDELDAEERAFLDAHVRDCAECAAHLADLASVDDAARQVPLVVPDGYFEDFAPRVRARLGERTTRRRFGPPAWGWAVAAALLLAVVTPLALQRSQAPALDRAKTAASSSEGARGGFDQGAHGLPPATVAVPEAPRPAPPAAAAPRPADAASEQDAFADRTLEGRLARRDRDAPAPALSEDALPAVAAPPALRTEPEQPKRAVAEAQKEKLEATDAVGKKVDDERPPAEERTAGYVAPPPPATNQRQYGPRAQNSTYPSAPAPAAKAVVAAESKDKQQAGEATLEKAADAGGAGASSTMQETVEVSPSTRYSGTGEASAKFRSMAEETAPRTDADARRMREAWRAFAAEHPDHPQADEARVRTVEAGALAYRLGRRPQDRETAMRDARAYLERAAAPQAARVQAVLKTLSSGAP
jgi:anti-sigma factor RsiW